MPLICHHALLIINKPWLEGLMNSYLQQAGISTFTLVHSHADALSMANKIMPHVIIVYEDALDTTAVQIIEMLAIQPVLNRALIFVIVEEISKELLAMAKLIKVILIDKTIDNTAFIKIIRQKLQLLGGLSPYSIRGDTLPSGSHASIRVPIKIMEKINDNILCLSPLDAKPESIVSILPENKKFSPFTTTFIEVHNEQSIDGNFYVSFSLNSIIGNGHKWLTERTNYPVACYCLVPVKIIALDECGGVILSSITLAPDAEFIIDHPFLTENKVFGAVKIIGFEPYKSNTNMSIIRFLFVNAPDCKQTHWNNIYHLLDAAK